MTSWVALLRGVNVGGITLRSADLAELFRQLELFDVSTVLASGNVAFRTDSKESTAGEAEALKPSIEQALSDRFGYEAWIVLLSRDRLVDIVAAYPFDTERDGWHSYVLFGSKQAPLDELAKLSATVDPADDVVAPGDGVLYWHNRRERGVKSAFSVLTAKPRFKPTTTNRNIRTLRKVLAV